jgi:hypothetical protein
LIYRRWNKNAGLLADWVMPWVITIIKRANRSSSTRTKFPHHLYDYTSRMTAGRGLPEIVNRTVVVDVLQRIGDGFDKVGLAEA